MPGFLLILALRYLSGENGGGVLPLSDDVMKQLRKKHPEAQEAQLGTLVFGTTEQVRGDG